MQCSQCGTKAQPNQTFCRACGTPLQEIATSETTFDEQAEEPSWLDDKPDISSTTPIPDRQSPTPDTRYPLLTYGSVEPYHAPREAEAATQRRDARRPFVAAILGVLLIVPCGLSLAFLTLNPNASERVPFLALGPTDTATALPFTAQELLDRSAQAMSAVQTFQYRSEAGFYGIETPSPVITSTNAYTLTFSGGVRLPDSYTINTNVPQIGQFIIIGETAWNRRDGSPNWLEQPSSQITLGPANPLAFAGFSRFYEPDTAEIIGTEVKDRATLYQVRFDVETKRMAKEAASNLSAGELENTYITADAWIRGTDYLLDRLALDMELAGGTNAVLRSFFTNYGGEVDINPPVSSP